jgi:hypothetical protein
MTGHHSHLINFNKKHFGWLLLLVAVTVALLAVRSYAEDEVYAHGPLGEDAMTLAAVSQSHLFPMNPASAPLVNSVAASVPIHAMVTASTAGGVEAQVGADPRDVYTIFQSPKKYSWGEWATWAATAAAGYYIYDKNQGGGGGPKNANAGNPQPGGPTVIVNGDNNHVNFQGSGSGGSGQQIGQESLSGATAGGVAE